MAAPIKYGMTWKRYRAQFAAYRIPWMIVEIGWRNQAPVEWVLAEAERQGVLIHKRHERKLGLGDVQRMVANALKDAVAHADRRELTPEARKAVAALRGFLG